MVSVDAPMIQLHVAGCYYIYGVIGYKYLIESTPSLCDVVLVGQDTFQQGELEASIC